MTDTFPPEAADRLRAYLDAPGRVIPAGLGSREAACSLAAINLALTGELTDDIPPCMSRVVGRWILVIQDAMPDAARNAREWRELLPLAAGTGRERERERERMAVALDWMWAALEVAQDVGDRGGFGLAWRAMCSERAAAAAYAAAAAADADAAYAADAAANAANAAYAAAAVAAANAAYAAAYAAAAAAAAAYAAADAAATAAAAAADAAAYAASANAADAAAYAASANAADAAAYAASAADAWAQLDPAGCLRRMIQA